MSKPLNGRARSCPFPFNSAEFVSPGSAENFPLNNVLAALGSNVPARVARVADDVCTSGRQVGAALNVLGEVMHLREVAAQAGRSDEIGLFASDGEIASALNLLSGLTSLHADMMLQCVEAARRLTDGAKNGDE